MNIRNLVIVDSVKLKNCEAVLERIEELERFIDTKYNSLNTETAIEFNIGSKMNPYSMHLVIYNHPQRKNNPYVFISARLNEERILVNKAELAFFSGLLDYNLFRDLKISLQSGFNHLPRYAFLSESEIEKARQFSKEYDELDR